MPIQGPSCGGRFSLANRGTCVKHPSRIKSLKGETGLAAMEIYLEANLEAEWEHLSVDLYLFIVPTELPTIVAGLQCMRHLKSESSETSVQI